MQDEEEDDDDDVEERKSRSPPRIRTSMRSSLVLLLIAAFVLAGEYQISLSALSLAKISLHTSRSRVSNSLRGGARESSTSLSGLAWETIFLAENLSENRSTRTDFSADNSSASSSA